MKALNLAVLALLTACTIFAFSTFKRQEKFLNVTAVKLNSVSCNPDLDLSSENLKDDEIQPIPGVGYHQWKISTDSDSAQFYFNQGINLHFGFHKIEALASFKKAADIDPTCAMAWWGQALSYGPTINDIGYTEKPEALTIITKAILLSQSLPPIEKVLIEAMKLRYSLDSTEKRERLNQNYADAMRNAYERLLGHPDVAALYADALMVQHPWNYWNQDGSAKVWTPTIQAVLEKLLVKNPNHPGANHYYIHLMEASPFADKALASADRLGQLTPGQAHMVHMPSHIYLRTGHYEKSILVNKASVTLIKERGILFSPMQPMVMFYQMHNQHMSANCAMLAGQYNAAINLASQMQQSMDSANLSIPEPLGNMIQYIYMTPAFINVRFEKWNKLIQMKQPPSKDVYANVLYRFGKGIAYAGLKDIVNAKQELGELQKLMSEKTLTLPIGPFSTPIEGTKVANELLQGFINMKENKFDLTIAHFLKAVQIEDNISYHEPRDWLLNPRQYLGVVYLKSKQWKDAALVFEKDLNRNADNIWSLYGLSQALTAQNNKTAGRVKLRLNKAMEKSDVIFSELDLLSVED